MLVKLKGNNQLQYLMAVLLVLAILLPLGVFALALVAKSFSLFFARRWIDGCYFLLAVAAFATSIHFFRFYKNETPNDNSALLLRLGLCLMAIMLGLLATRHFRWTILVLSALVVLVAFWAGDNGDNVTSSIVFFAIVCACSLALFIFQLKRESLYLAGLGLVGVLPLVWAELVMWCFDAIFR